MLSIASLLLPALLLTALSASVPPVTGVTSVAVVPAVASISDFVGNTVVASATVVDDGSLLLNIMYTDYM